MYGLNATALLLFGSINLLAYQLCKAKPGVRKAVMTALCSVLLGGNAIRYLFVYPFFQEGIQLPVEFSTVAYFVVPTILLCKRRSLISWAAYAGLMAGFFYYLALIAAGGPLYEAYPVYDTYISMFCHGTLYVCGFVTIATVPICEKDWKKLVFGVILAAAWAILLRPFVDGTKRLFIYILLDGAVIKALLPPQVWSKALPVYYIVAASMVLLSVWGFLKSSQKQYHKFSRCTKQMTAVF